MIIKNDKLISFPKMINQILDMLNANGYEAYIVGGAVRDLLLNSTPNDYDIVTSALPEEVIRIATKTGFKVIGEVGHNFGVVLVSSIDGCVEIATFRGERYGINAHKPDKIWFCNNLREDLARRDFTINAMAMDKRGNVYDYHNGRKDLENKVLRTVGIAKLRFNEDALRMYRVCRFIGQLGFNYMQDGVNSANSVSLATAMVSYDFPIERSDGLSLERVRAEVEKLLVSEFAGKGLRFFLSCGLAKAKCQTKVNGEKIIVDVLPELVHLEGLAQNNRFHCYDAWEHTLAAVDNGSRSLIIRWALLLHDVGKGLPGIRKTHDDGQPSDHGHEARSAIIAKIILERFGYSSSFIRRVVWLISRHMRFAPMLITGKKSLLKWVRSEALSGEFKDQKDMTNAFEQLVEVFLSDMKATHAGKNHKLMAEGEKIGASVIAIAKNEMPVHTKDLAISGEEVLKLLTEPQKIKFVMQYLLQRVQSGSLDNKNNSLLAAIEVWQKKLNGGNSSE